jgi:sulfate adenylyltransferase subunit 1
MDLLRFITAGSVDDGKSTLIGRLLYDSKNIMVDQLEQLEKQSKNTENADIDLALLTDGLRAEREQGITIDIAYRYFTTPTRKFIIADAPGHIQYTRNMITGASNSDLIIILIDARHGVVEQTRRHSIIASLLKIKHVVVAVNKMDLISFDENAYSNIVADYSAIAKKLDLNNVHFLPISAALGDNVVDLSTNTPWYNSMPLLSLLESIDVSPEEEQTARFQTQLVLRPQTKDLHDFRAYLGRVASGTYSTGDEVVVLPAGIETKVSKLYKNGNEVSQVFASESISMELEDNIDISRGDSIVKKNQMPQVASEINVLIGWMDEKPMILGNKYILQHNSRTARAIIKELQYKIDVNSLEKQYDVANVQLNEIVMATVKTSLPLVFDSYATLKNQGSAILIDETSNNTVGAIIIQ